MVRKKRQFIGLAAVAVGCLTFIGLASLGRAESQDVVDQKLRQQITQQAAEELIHRIGAMLRVMEYYQPDKASQRASLESVAKTLAGLSREQMDEVLQRLDKAAAEPDPAKSAKELEQAHARHLEIMHTLRELLALYESITTVDQIADKLDKLARGQLHLALQAVRLSKEPAGQDQYWDFGVRGKGTLSAAQLRNLALGNLASDQSQLREDIEKILKKAFDLQLLLPFDQRDLLHRLQDAVDFTQLPDTLKQIGQKLENIENAWGNEQNDRAKAAYLLQRQAADDVMDLAGLLRQPKDDLAAMRKAHQQLEETIREQTELRDQVLQRVGKTAKDASPPLHENEPLESPQKGKKGKGGFFDQRDSTAPPMQDDRLAKEMSDLQARLALDARDTSNLLKPISLELADMIDNSRTPMRTAEEAIREATPRNALQPQDTVLEVLNDAKTQLEKMIAKAEEQRRDPLAALKDAAETVEKLLKEQIATRDLTKDIGDTKQADKLPQVAPQQIDLSKRTDALNSKPLPNAAKTQKSLDQAARAMDKAVKDLLAQKAPDAVSKQEDAIKSLEDAKKSLDQQIAEIEKRREDIAKMEDAAQKLAQLTKDEAKVADQAAEKIAQPSPNTKDLAKKQGELTPKAKDLARSLDQLVPKAATKVDMGAKNMDQARKDLEKNQAQPGADEANKAVDRLKEAADLLAKKLDDLKAKELADQAAMKNLDPATVAQQLQKAIEQTKQAIQQAQKAQDQALQKSLADQQKQIADEAKQMKLDKAANPAYDAAKSLQKGDLKKALDAQQQALDKLQQAAKGDKGAQGDKGQSKDSQGQQGDPKQLAQQQKDLMDLVKQLAQQQAQKSQQGAQKANQGAMQTLGQAIAGAPQGIQQQMQQAAGNLGKAGQQLKQGSPQPATQAQKTAVDQMQKALKQLQGATTAKKDDGKKGQKGDGKDVAKGKGDKGKGDKGKGDKALAKNGKKQGKADELNNKGDGNRLADGKVSNTQSQLQDITGSDVFLQLPPRQRELIRQALAGTLPPDHAAQIQQYFLNISKGQSGGGGGIPPPSQK